MPVVTRVFFSFQTWIGQKTNKEAIEAALEKAKEDLKATITLEWSVATTDMPGAKNIFDEIQEKIQNADIYFADITEVAQKENQSLPNPNVLIEVGYAIGEVGWNRMVLFLNSAHGKIDFVPFNIRNNRISRYNLSDEKNMEKVEKLHKLVKDAIEAIIKDAPKRPSELRNVPIEKLRHDSDVRNIRRLLSRCHLPSIQTDLKIRPDYALWAALDSWDHLETTVSDYVFNVHDDQLKKALKELEKCSQQINRYGHAYQLSPNGGKLKLSPDLPSSPSLDEERNQIAETCQSAHIAIVTMRDRIIAAFPEIDLADLSEQAWQDYVRRNPDEFCPTATPSP